MSTAKQISSKLHKLASPKLAKLALRFTKTGTGEYGEGDKFLGIRMPVLRAQSKEWSGTSVSEAFKLLTSPWHEERSCALLILVEKYQVASEAEKEKIYRHYLANTKFINNWDLVDCSAHLIVGPYLLNKSKAPLTKLVKSESLWERRIGILATFHYIKQNQFDQTLRIATLLLSDNEDLIHKAVGWMLRETGKRDLKTEVDFLKQHYHTMPRTMLRYAIEKFPETKRKKYLLGTA